MEIYLSYIKQPQLQFKSDGMKADYGASMSDKTDIAHNMLVIIP